MASLPQEKELLMIIDFEGFYCMSQFLIREVGYTLMHDNVSVSLHYKPSVPYNYLSGKEKYTVRYVQTHIHGLSYTPKKQYRYDWKKDFLELYNRLRTKTCRYVAFKGGHVERNFLNALNIPNINIELYGCPKFNEITKTESYNIKSCGRHRDPDKHHCPKVETFYFKKWLKMHVFKKCK